MTTCVDNPALGLIGCGQSYGGELQHSVARVPWSAHPDGRAHVTASLSVIDRCWEKGRGQMADPVQLGYEQDSRGLWRRPLSDEDRLRLAQIRSDPRPGISLSHETV